jgi:protein gp37
MVQVQSFVEDYYPKVTKSRNPNKLWQLLHQSHIMMNSAVTDEEKRAAVKRLEDLRQVAEDGRTVSQYNES